MTYPFNWAKNYPTVRTPVFARNVDRKSVV